LNIPESKESIQQIMKIKILKQKKENRKKYNLILSDLKDNPLNRIKIGFALMGIIPLLIFIYLLIGRNYLYDLLVGNNGFIVAIAVLISIMGFLVAYRLVIEMMNKLILFFLEKKMADEEKIQLMSAFTHDVKTPLTVIKTGMQNLLDGIGGTLNTVHNKIANMCVKAADNATDFINQMLEIAKIKLNILGLNRELIDLNKIIEKEIKQIEILAQKNNQKISYEINSEDTRLWGDKKQLSRAVMNLLSNAVKYANINGKINIALSSDNKMINMTVVNTGKGIPCDKLDKIFNKYQRLKSDSKVEGSGIGLSIVKDIIELHKGHITVKSEPNFETEFTVSLPKDLRQK